MLIGAVADDVAQVFGMPNFAAAPGFTQNRILIDINSGIQQMQNAGEDYYLRQELTVPFVAGQEEYDLDDTIREILDPVRLDDGTLLKKLTSRGQLYQFGQLFFDQLDDDVLDGVPMFYYVQSMFRSADAEEVNIVLHFLPRPSATYVSTPHNAVVPVVEEPTSFTLPDLTAGTAVLPVPAAYVESIFLPLVRWNATTSFLFYEKDKIPRYEQEYTRAVRLLEQADPRRPKPPESRAGALEIDQPSAQAPISPVQKTPPTR